MLKSGADTNLEKCGLSGIELRRGDFATLSEGLDYAATGKSGFNFYAPRGHLEAVLPFSELRERALATGRKLIAAGLKRGERVGVVAETGTPFMEVFFGCQYAGLIPCPMPYSIYIGGRDSYVKRIEGMLNSADASAIIAPQDLISHVQEAAKNADVRLALSHDELDAIEADDVEITAFGPDDVAYIQYSSGSTSQPKGVLITQKAVCTNVQQILVHGMDQTPEDRSFSWLPLYHDMGLVGFCLSSVLGQATTDYLSTTAFARRPALWLKLMSENRCTVAYSPTFGYELAGRRINGDAPTLDLSAWRVAGIGGDMVRPDVLEEFAERLSVAGFEAKSFMPSYGMAENTLAVTTTEVDRPLKIDTIDRAHYKISRRAVPVENADQVDPASVRSFVVCGGPLPDHEIEVRDDNDVVLGEREIGHIIIKGPSLMSGYFKNEEATNEVMRSGGWMGTGDMGYWLDGELVITGRSKDLILHNGRNIWPQDIEWAAEHVEPLRTGDAAAFGLEDEDLEDKVVVLVHCRLHDEDGRDKLRRDVMSAVNHSSGVECHVVLVPPRSLPFTSSGKLSRAGAKAGFVSGEIAEIAPVVVSAPAREAVPMQAAE
ncbi:MAG: fatty acyl-AMP ligase [Hyphomicrobiales bacterium]